MEPNFVSILKLFLKKIVFLARLEFINKQEVKKLTSVPQNHNDEYLKKLLPETKYRVEIVTTNYSIMNSKSKNINELLIVNF